MHLDLEAVAVLLGDAGRVPGEQGRYIRRCPAVILQPPDRVHERLGALAFRGAALDQAHQLGRQILARPVVPARRLALRLALGLRLRAVQPCDGAVDLRIHIRQRVGRAGHLVARDRHVPLAGPVDLDAGQGLARHREVPVHLRAYGAADDAQAGARGRHLGVARGLGDHGERPFRDLAGGRIAAFVEVEHAEHVAGQRVADPVRPARLVGGDRGLERAPGLRAVALGVLAGRVGAVRHLRELAGLPMQLPAPHQPAGLGLHAFESGRQRPKLRAVRRQRRNDRGAAHRRASAGTTP